MHYTEVTKTVKHDKWGEREIKFTAPQVDNAEELIQFFSGPQELVSRMNKIIARSAPQTGVLRLQKSDAQTLEAYEEQIAKEVANAKTYKPEVSSGPSKNAKADAVDRIASFAQNHREAFASMTPDEMLAYLTEQKLPERFEELLNASSE